MTKTTTIQSDVLALFNCLVVHSNQEVGAVFTGLADQGIVTNFDPEYGQLVALEEVYKPLPLTTLFSREERENASLSHLIVKQLLHYIEIYGLGAPGLFDLEHRDGTLISMNFVSGVTIEVLEVMVQMLLYRDAPVKDVDQLKRIIDYWRIKFDINRVANNELRVLLWNEAFEPFKSGDDAVRYMCYQATSQMLLIKSKEVIASIKKAAIPSHFFTMHETALAKVFNRHKALILAAKTKATAKAINRISRLSKTAHVPVRESIAKTFVHKALTFRASASDLKHVTVRDKMKYLNVLAEKKVQSGFGLFQIRNGKVWYDEDRTVFGIEDVNRVEGMVLHSLAADLEYLKDKSLLLDRAVDYGLPTSRKQTLGRLPFGTRVISSGNEISSGMYWENSWGSRDLDLSSVTKGGARVGWGHRSGYENADIIFSGDITNAPDGAMEFLTSRSKDYGLVVNIYAGEPGSEMELVVGSSQGKKHWMGDIIIREKTKLASRNCLLGFVKGKTFIVYGARMNNRIVSEVNPTLRAIDTEFWTLQDLFGQLAINYDVDKQDEVEYDHDLSYSSFSYDKLEAVFENSAT